MEHAFAGIGSDYRRATAIQLMANGRSQVFALRSHLPSCVSPTQERRHASFSSPVKHHARMADIKRIDGGHIDEHHRMCPCNRADGAQMPFLQRMLLGGDADPRLFVPNAARVLKQSGDIAVPGPLALQCRIQGAFELRQATVERHPGDGSAVAEHHGHFVASAQAERGEHA